MTVYGKGEQVYVLGARTLGGPYTIKEVNSDGTYQLEDADGSIYRANARERDLKPL